MTRILKICIFLLLVTFAPAFAPAFAGTPLPRWYSNAITRSEAQLLAAAQQYGNSGKTPRTYEHGKIQLVSSNDWTSGFFPGSLWYAYELTGNEQLRSDAEKFTAFVADAQYRKNTHDLGFILYCSYGNGYRITGNAAYRQVLETGAKSLMSRYNRKTGLIKSWDPGVVPWEFPVIIDNMMNLEFLYNMGHLTGNKSMTEAAVSHANNTLKNHFRQDYSCYHVVAYDSISGNVADRQTHQGYSDESSWARGQGWALYGFTMMYRETKNPAYLAQAQKVASFILNHPRLPSDKVPYWDFDDSQIPNAPRDASAAAVIASALIELSTFTPDKNQYFDTAEIILKNLSDNKYLAKKGTNGFFILMHSTGNKPKKSEIDTPLSYADYYYLEALKRYRSIKQTGHL